MRTLWWRCRNSYQWGKNHRPHQEDPNIAICSKLSAGVAIIKTFLIGHWFWKCTHNFWWFRAVFLRHCEMICFFLQQERAMFKQTLSDTVAREAHLKNGGVAPIILVNTCCYLRKYGRWCVSCTNHSSQHLLLSPQVWYVINVLPVQGVLCEFSSPVTDLVSSGMQPCFALWIDVCTSITRTAS